MDQAPHDAAGKAQQIPADMCIAHICWVTTSFVAFVVVIGVVTGMIRS